MAPGAKKARWAPVTAEPAPPPPAAPAPRARAQPEPAPRLLELLPRCSPCARGWEHGSTAPSLSALRSSKHSGGGGGGGGSADPAWTSALSGNSSGPGPGSRPRPAAPSLLCTLCPPLTLRQANRLPIKVLKMLTARTGHILHPEYPAALPSTPVSP